AEEILMNPANDYVERFVEDVDLAKVLTAEHVMKRAENVTVDRGPQVALKMMRDNGISTIYVVDKYQKLLGIVTADDASKAAKEILGLVEVLTKDVPKRSPEAWVGHIDRPVPGPTGCVCVVESSENPGRSVARRSVIAAIACEHAVNH